MRKEIGNEKGMGREGGKGNRNWNRKGKEGIGDEERNRE